MPTEHQSERAGWFRALRTVQRAFSAQFGSPLKWTIGVSRLVRFWTEYRRYRKLNRGRRCGLSSADVFPCLNDRVAITPVDPTYYYQETWFARRIAERRPSSHVDVGSSARTMAVIGQFVPVSFVDIRPVDLPVAGFTMITGSILALPFSDRSVGSLSSLCVIEHIGLGRYGDPFDPLGTEKAAAELQRVLAAGGDLYVSVPVDSICRIYFNAHRAFTRDYVLSLFAGLELRQERYIYGASCRDSYAAARGFGTGMYHWHRP